MDRTSSAVIEAHFQMMERVIESKELDIKSQVKLMESVTRGIRSIASLELEHKKLNIRAPEMAKSAKSVLRLVEVVEPKAKKQAASGE